MSPITILLLKVTLLLGAGWLAALALRKNAAAARHLVWILTLSGVLLLTLTAPVTPVLPLRIAAWQSVPRTNGQSGPGESLSAPQPSDRPYSSTTNATAAARGLPSLSTGQLLLSGWLLGALLVLGWGLLGHIGLARIVRRATPLPGREWDRLGQSLAQGHGVVLPVRILRSAAVGSPVIWGMRRPVVLLPQDAESWPLERRRVVLAHELAHAARGDAAAQLIAWVACALYWFHPLAWVAARRLRMESERACDDRVVSSGIPGADYAAHLLDVARGSHSLRPGGMVAIGMARPSQLEGRLLAVLDETRQRAAPSTLARVAACLGVALLVFPLAALRPVPTVAPSVTPVPEHAPAPAPVQQERDSTFQRELPASPGGVLALELESGGSVDIRPWDEPWVRVHARLAGENWRDTRVSFERSGPGVRLRSWQEVRRGSSSTSHEFEILVPKRYSVRINSAGGELTIVGLEGEFSGQTGGGAITIERASGRAELSTGGGDIRVSESDLAGSVSTGGGMVQLSQVRGGLRGSSGSGPVITGGEGTRSLRDVKVEGEVTWVGNERDAEIRKLQVRLEELRKADGLERERTRRVEGAVVRSEQQRDAELRKLQVQLEEVRKASGDSLDRMRTREARVRDEQLKQLESRLTEIRKERDGTLRAENYRIGEQRDGLLWIRKAGGAIVLEEAPDGAEVETGGGRIQIGRSAGWISASTGGGDVSIGPVAGSVRAGTGAGDVEITLVDADGKEQSVEVKTGKGSLVLELPRGYSGRFDLETAYTDGFGRRTRIRSDFELEQSETTEWDERFGSPRKYVRATGRTGTAGGSIKVRIVNGDITVRRGG